MPNLPKPRLIALGIAGTLALALAIYVTLTHQWQGVLIGIVLSAIVFIFAPVVKYRNMAHRAITAHMVKLQREGKPYSDTNF